MAREIYDMTMALSESSTLTQVSNALAANSEEMNAKTDIMAALEEITVALTIRLWLPMIQNNMSVVASAIEDVASHITWQWLPRRPRECGTGEDGHTGDFDMITRIAVPRPRYPGGKWGATAIKELNISLGMSAAIPSAPWL